MMASIEAWFKDTFKNYAVKKDEIGDSLIPIHPFGQLDFIFPYKIGVVGICTTRTKHIRGLRDSFSKIEIAQKCDGEIVLTWNCSNKPLTRKLFSSLGARKKRIISVRRRNQLIKQLENARAAKKYS